MGGEVAGEEDQVDRAVDLVERLARLLAVRLAAVHVARGGDLDARAVRRRSGAAVGFDWHRQPRYPSSVHRNQSGGYMPGVPDHPFADIEATLKKSVAAFREAGVPALLAGSLAVWARGGPETRHDLDFVVKPDDAEKALQALVDVGMEPERPPEGWLLKAWDGEVLVDVIFEPRGLVVDDDLIARGEEREVMAIGIRLMALEDVLTSKLMALDEHSADYSQLLLMTRTLREQIDWGALRARTSSSPFAKAFFTLAEELSIAPPAGDAVDAPATRARVRVLDG